MDDKRYKFHRSHSYGLLKDINSIGDIWYSGYVGTRYGFVTVYSQGGARDGFTTLSIIRDGHEYTRRFERGFQKAYLVTLAQRFAQEVSHGE